MKRIGPKMEAAASYVSRNQGCAILPVALAVGPHRSTNFGYRTVWRAVRAGLLVAYPGARQGTYSLYTDRATAEVMRSQLSLFGAE